MNTHTDNDYEQVVSRLILESPQVKITSVASDMLLSDIGVDSLEKLSIAMDLEEAYIMASDVMVENMLAKDAHEGITAFIEKRDPVWRDQ